MLEGESGSLYVAGKLRSIVDHLRCVKVNPDGQLEQVYNCGCFLEINQHNSSSQQFRQNYKHSTYTQHTSIHIYIIITADYYSQSVNPIMYKYTYFVVALAASPFVMSQAITFCKDEDCVDCPSAITTAGEDVKTDCVIYDTQTVFGGQGFEELDGEFLYGAYASYTEPCGGEPGALMIRSPAQLSDLYCGDLARYSTDAGCGSAQVQLQETFSMYH